MAGAVEFHRTISRAAIFEILHSLMMECNRGRLYIEMYIEMVNTTKFNWKERSLGMHNSPTTTMARRYRWFE